MDWEANLAAIIKCTDEQLRQQFDKFELSDPSSFLFDQRFQPQPPHLPQQPPQQQQHDASSSSSYSFHSGMAGHNLPEFLHRASTKAPSSSFSSFAVGGRDKTASSSEFSAPGTNRNNNNNNNVPHVESCLDEDQDLMPPPVEKRTIQELPPFQSSNQSSHYVHNAFHPINSSSYDIAQMMEQIRLSIKLEVDARAAIAERQLSAIMQLAKSTSEELDRLRVEVCANDRQLHTLDQIQQKIRQEVTTQKDIGFHLQSLCGKDESWRIQAENQLLELRQMVATLREQGNCIQVSMQEKLSRPELLVHFNAAVEPVKAQLNATIHHQATQIADVTRTTSSCNLLLDSLTKKVTSQAEEIGDLKAQMQQLHSNWNKLLLSSSHSGGGSTATGGPAPAPASASAPVGPMACTCWTTETHQTQLKEEIGLQVSNALASKQNQWMESIAEPIERSLQKQLDKQLDFTEKTLHKQVETFSNDTTRNLKTTESQLDHKIESIKQSCREEVLEARLDRLVQRQVHQWATKVQEQAKQAAAAASGAVHAGGSVKPRRRAKPRSPQRVQIDQITLSCHKQLESLRDDLMLWVKKHTTHWNLEVENSQELLKVATEAKLAQMEEKLRVFERKLREIAQTAPSSMAAAAATTTTSSSSSSTSSGGDQSWTPYTVMAFEQIKRLLEQISSSQQAIASLSSPRAASTSLVLPVETHHTSKQPSIASDATLDTASPVLPVLATLTMAEVVPKASVKKEAVVNVDSTCNSTSSSTVAARATSVQELQSSKPASSAMPAPSLQTQPDSKRDGPSIEPPAPQTPAPQTPAPSTPITAAGTSASSTAPTVAGMTSTSTAIGSVTTALAAPKSFSSTTKPPAYPPPPISTAPPTTTKPPVAVDPLQPTPPQHTIAHTDVPKMPGPPIPTAPNDTENKAQNTLESTAKRAMMEAEMAKQRVESRRKAEIEMRQASASAVTAGSGSTTPTSTPPMTGSDTVAPAAATLERTKSATQLRSNEPDLPMKRPPSFPPPPSTPPPAHLLAAASPRGSDGRSPSTSSEIAPATASVSSVPLTSPPGTSRPSLMQQLFGTQAKAGMAAEATLVMNTADTSTSLTTSTGSRPSMPPPTPPTTTMQPPPPTTVSIAPDAPAAPPAEQASNDPKRKCAYCLLEFDPLELASHEVLCEKMILKQCPHCLRRKKANELQDHINTCDCRLVSCPNDCGGKFLQRGLQKHLLTRCPKRSTSTTATGTLSVSTPGAISSQEQSTTGDSDASGMVTAPSGEKHECKFCDEEFPAKDIEDHEQTCDWKPKRCQHCNMVIISRDLARHEANCRQSSKACSYCNEMMPLTTLASHASRCVKRPIKCIRCCELFPADTIVEHSTSCRFIPGSAIKSASTTETATPARASSSSSSSAAAASSSLTASMVLAGSAPPPPPPPAAAAPSSHPASNPVSRSSSFTTTTAVDPVRRSQVLSQLIGGTTTAVAASNAQRTNAAVPERLQVRDDDHAEEDDDEEDEEEDDGDEDQLTLAQVVAEWNVENVCLWLQEDVGVAEVVSRFHDNQCTGAMLLELTESDLINAYGIKSRMHRERILCAIDAIKTSDDVDDEEDQDDDEEEHELKETKEEQEPKTVQTVPPPAPTMARLTIRTVPITAPPQMDRPGSARAVPLQPVNGMLRRINSALGSDLSNRQSSDKT